MAAATAPKPISRPGARDRVFFSGMAIAMALAVFIGFSRTYFLSWFFGTHATVTGAPFTTVVHVHAALFTAWVLLFIVQTALVATRRVAVHRRLGVVGAALAAGMIVAGIAISIAAARRGAAPPGLTPEGFLVVPLGDTALFALFVVVALLQRRNKDAHKRLMLLAYTAIAVAGVARIPGVLAHGPLAFFSLTYIPVLLLGMSYDFFTMRRVHPVYLWGGALLILSVPVRLALSGTQLWQSFAGMLMGK
ncbi:MAG: hypothetical protein M3P27_10050 [Acidobacteriota bacterium]|nr:hypothetical protein [Acidobacteriota bacterium]